MAAIINFKTLLKSLKHVKLLTDSFHDKQEKTNTHAANSVNFSIIMAAMNETRSEWMVQGTYSSLMVRPIAISPQQELTMAVNTTAFWDVAQSSLVASYQDFVGSWCLYLQSRGALKRKPKSFSKTLVTIYQITQHQNAEDSNIIHFCENLKSHTIIGIHPNLHERNGMMNFRDATNAACHEPMGTMSYFTLWICEERTVQSARLCAIQLFICFSQTLLLGASGLLRREWRNCTKQQGSLMLTMRTKGEHFLSMKTN